LYSNLFLSRRKLIPFSWEKRYYREPTKKSHNNRTTEDDSAVKIRNRIKFRSFYTNIERW